MKLVNKQNKGVVEVSDQQGIRLLSSGEWTRYESYKPEVAATKRATRWDKK